MATITPATRGSAPAAPVTEPTFDAPSSPEVGRRRRLGNPRGLLPLGPVAGAVIFNLWSLRAELAGVQNLNDTPVHLGMVRWAAQRIQHGHSPLDGWFPNLALGSPLFHSYQSFPHVLVGLIGSIFGVDRIFHWSLYLLLACWPVAVYASVRLFGLNRWTAAGAGMVCGLLVSASNYGYEHGSYTWRGIGLWSQIFGMWLLPLTLALAWRTVHHARSPVPAAIALGLTIVCHLQTGYLAILAMGVFVLVDWHGFWRRVVRSGFVLLGGLLTAGYLLVPIALDSGYSLQSQFNKGTVFTDSYGARRVLGWLVTGRLFDQGRLPVISVLVLVGAVVCLVRARHNPLARALLVFEALSLALFFGRPTWGAALGLLPGSSELFFHRFIAGVHLGGIVLAGVGAAWLAETALAGARWVRAGAPAGVVGAVAVGVAAVLLVPAVRERAAFDRQGAGWMRTQRTAESTDGADLDRLLARLAGLPPGRTYAGMVSNWGGSYRIGYVPVSIVLFDHGIDAIGFTLRTPSLNSDVEAVFDESNPFQYEMLGVRYLVLPEDRQPAVPATRIDRQGRHTLWSVDGVGGYLQVVDTVGTITANGNDIARQSSSFRAQRALGSPYPTVDFPGRPAAAPTAPSGAGAGPAGEVDIDVPTPAAGVFAGAVTANRDAVVVLKSTFSPRWQVTVDGRKARTEMVAPALVGVRVSPGRHTVVFRYQNFSTSGWLIAIAGLGLLLLGWVWRRWSWWRTAVESGRVRD